MTAYDVGDVVLVRFPFTDLTSDKKRPAVVLSPVEYSTDFGDIVLMPLTSQPDRESAFALSQWKGAGLLKPTWVKPLVGTLSVRLVLRRLGGLQKDDEGTVCAALKILLAERWRRQVLSG
jgi:mRNA interferase MazF